MWFVEILIYQLVVKESVNPVNAHVSEKQERDHAENQPGPTKRRIIDSVIKFAVSSDLGEEQCYCGYADPWQRPQSILYFTLHLILQKLRVVF